MHQNQPTEALPVLREVELEESPSAQTQHNLTKAVGKGRGNQLAGNRVASNDTVHDEVGMETAGETFGL